MQSANTKTEQRVAMRGKNHVRGGDVDARESTLEQEINC